VSREAPLVGCLIPKAPVKKAMNPGAGYNNMQEIKSVPRASLIYTDMNTSWSFRSGGTK
jgi:hypothetical protein